MVLFTALLAPMFVDWRNYTEQFEAEASRIAGQPVKVNGDVNLRILPLPTVNFEGLEVGRNEDGSPMMTVERFSLIAELMPFLSGEVRIVEMSMLRPQVNLKVEADGTVAWTDRQQLLVDPQAVKLDTVKIRNGSISIDGLAGGRRFDIEGLQAEVSASSLLGPWRIDANGLVEGVDTEFNIRTGTLQNSGTLRLKVDIARLDKPYKLSMDGPVQLQGDVLQWTGDFRTAVRALDKRQAAQSLPVSSEGQFVASPEQVEIPEYRLEIGPSEDPYVVTGQGRADIKDRVFFSVTADGRQVDLDRIGEEVEATESVPNLERRLMAIRSVIERIPVPSADGLIDVQLPALVAGDTFIREVSARVSPTESGWELRSVSALMPGDTRMEASGRLGIHEDFGFTGKLLIASRQPSGFASWISGRVDPAFRNLRAAGMSANVTLTQKQASFEELELVLGNATLQGSVQRLAAIEGRPGIVAKLEGEHINLELLRAVYGLTQNETQPHFAEHDLDLDVRAGLLEGDMFEQSFTAKEVAGRFQVREGELSIDRLDATDFYGAKITSSGRLDNILSRPNGNMKMVVEARDLSQLIDFMQKSGVSGSIINQYTSDPTLTENSLVEIEADMRANGGTGQLLWRGEIGGTFIEGRARLNGPFAKPGDVEISLSSSAENSDPSALLRQAGAYSLPVDVSGPLKFNAELNGSLGQGFFSVLSASSPNGDLTADGHLRFENWKLAGSSLDFTLGSKDIVPLVSVLAIEVPTGYLESPAPLSATWSLEGDDNNLLFTALSGQLNNNPFSGTFKVSYGPTTRRKLTGQVSFGTISFPVLASELVGYGSIISPDLPSAIDTGERWNSRGFGEPLFAAADVELSISADQLYVGAGINARNASFQFTQSGDAIDVSGLSANLFDGQLSGGWRLKNEAGLANFSARIEINDSDLQTMVSNLGLPKKVNGRFSLSGTVEGTGRSVEGLVAELSGNGVINLSEAVIAGVRADRFEEILVAVDEEELEITPESIRALVEKYVMNGELPIGSAEAAFSILRGKLQARNLSLSVPGAAIKADIEASLPDASLSARSQLRFNAGKEALVGADPEIVFEVDGSSGELELRAETAALEGFLSLRRFEQNQRRIENMEAGVMEQQRLRRELQMANLRVLYRERKEAEARRKLEEQLRKLREEEERIRKEKQAAEEAARKQLEAEAAEQSAASEPLNGRASGAISSNTASETDSGSESGGLFQKGDPLKPFFEQLFQRPVTGN